MCTSISMLPRTSVFRFAYALGLAACLATALAACGNGYSFNEVATTEKAAGDSNTLPAPQGNCGTDTYANYGQAFVAQNCGPSCHPALSPPDLTTQAAIQGASKADLVNQVQGIKKMPLGGTLSDDDRARFANWVNCGAP